MLEETHENSKVLAKVLSQDLDVDAVFTTMKDLYMCARILYIVLYTVTMYAQTIIYYVIYCNDVCKEYHILYYIQ